MANIAYADGHAKAMRVRTPATIANAAVIDANNLGFLTLTGGFDDSAYNGTGQP
jgi:prepilin-type processing-associated H-X9-DG protein